MARAKEYAFLVYAGLLAAAYAVVHDQLTTTLSPEYFVYAKGLAPSSLRVDVVWLAVRAGLPMGLLGGAALLVANDPRRKAAGPSLAYRTLMGVAIAPLVGAALLACVLGVANASAQFGTATARALGVPYPRVWRFVIVWGMHWGSYVGGLLGVLGSVVVVGARRWEGRQRKTIADADRERRRRGSVRLIVGVVVAYGTVCLVARLGYRVLLYPAPPDAPLLPLPEGARLLPLRSEDGAVTIVAQLDPPDAQARTLVVFHGNGETMDARAGLAEDLHARRLGVVLAEFRGYGLARTSGPPDEAGLYRDASAVLDGLERQGIGRDRVALLGISLGTGVAAEMAARGRAAALILVSPYTSIPAVAAAALPFLPAAWLCPDRFDTLSKAPALRVPTLVIHGDEDEVVPFAMGRQVAAAIPGATLRVVRGGHHNDLFPSPDRALEDAIAEAAKR